MTPEPNEIKAEARATGQPRVADVPANPPLLHFAALPALPALRPVPAECREDDDCSRRPFLPPLRPLKEGVDLPPSLTSFEPAHPVLDLQHEAPAASAVPETWETDG